MSKANSEWLNRSTARARRGVRPPGSSPGSRPLSPPSPPGAAPRSRSRASCGSKAAQPSESTVTSNSRTAASRTVLATPPLVTMPDTSSRRIPGAAAAPTPGGSCRRRNTPPFRPPDRRAQAPRRWRAPRSPARSRPWRRNGRSRFRCGETNGSPSRPGTRVKCVDTTQPPSRAHRRHQRRHPRRHRGDLGHAEPGAAISAFRMDEVVLQIAQQQRAIGPASLAHRLDDQIAEPVDPSAMARLDQDRRVGLLRAPPGRSRPHRPAAPAGRAPRSRATSSNQTRRVPRCAASTEASASGCQRQQVDLRPPADHGGAQVQHAEGTPRQHPAISAAIRRLERVRDVPCASAPSPSVGKQRHGHGMRLADIAHVQLVDHLAPGEGDARAVEQRHECRGGRCHLRAAAHPASSVVEQPVQRVHPVVPHVGDHAAQRRGDAGEARHQRARRARPRGSARRHAARRRRRTASGVKLLRIVPALDRDEAQRAGHAGIGDAQDRLGRPRGVEAERAARPAASIARAAASTSSRASLPPIGRSALIRPSTTLASVTVGRVAAGAVADRARHGARALRPDLQQPAGIHPRDRAAARADRGDLDHRRADHQAEIERALRRQRRLARPRSARRRTRCRRYRR